MIEWKFYNKFKATSCSTYSHDNVQLQIYGLFYLNLSHTNTHFCDSKIPLQVLNDQLCMILLQQL